MLIFFSSLSDDKRPGLLSRSQVRKNELEKASLLKLSLNKVQNQSIKVVEKVNREQALAKSLISETDETATASKGLSMMKKMGFKIGESLGKQGGTSGIIEPIGIQIKTGREGLGVEDERKRKLEEAEERNKKFFKSRLKRDELNQNVFMKNKKQLFLLKQAKKYLRKAQNVCFQLDSQKVNEFLHLKTIIANEYEFRVLKNQKILGFGLEKS